MSRGLGALLNDQQIRDVIEKYMNERKLLRIPTNELYDMDKHFLKTPDQNMVDVAPFFQPVSFVDPTTVDIPQVFDGDALKVHDTDLDNRKEGEILLIAEAIAITANTIVYSSGFQTHGHQYLIVNILNPAWTTNPTSIAMGLQSSSDAFDTVTRDQRDSTGALVATAIDKEDSTVSYYTIATTPVPNLSDVYLARLIFTPVGTAESKNINVEVIGMTPR